MRTAQNTSRAVVAALAAASLISMAACSEDNGAPETDTEDGQAPTAQDRLENGRDALVEAGTVRLDLTSANLPSSGGAVLAGQGVGQLDPPAFDGEITARIAGIQADVPVVALGGDLWVRLPYTPSFVNRSAESLGVPDPANLFHPDRGVVTLLTLTEGAELGDATRARDEVLQEISGTVPGAAVRDIFEVGSTDADFDVVYGLIDDTDEVRTVTLTGPFYPPEESSYVLTLSDYGVDVDITAP